MTFSVNQRDFADALLHATRPVPAGITTARGESDLSRFAVYRNNVFVSLTKALAVRFPVTERLVGSDFFAGMARAYAQVRKPTSPLIMEYGDDFAHFIQHFAPVAGLSYLPDVVRLEAAWTRAYHAADAVPIGFSALAVESDALSMLRFAPHPSATLVRSEYPVGSIWAAHQHGTVKAPEKWSPETILVVRPAMDVRVHILPVRDAIFVATLFRGATLGEAAEAAIDCDRDFDFGTALVGLVGLGTFAVQPFDDERGQS